VPEGTRRGESSQDGTSYQNAHGLPIRMLMAFAARAEEQYQRAGIYIDRILRGASASALPIEQPTRFHLVVNLRTAKALGLTISPSVWGGRTKSYSSRPR
jgi:hypothetical protein